MFVRIITSSILFLSICVPAVVMSMPVVAILLHTSWEGRTTIFGNAKWGRANDHFSTPTSGWWQEFKWLVFRNPVNNLLTKTLAVDNSREDYILTGDSGIGDKTRGGFYSVRLGKFWEYYWVKPYGSRCVRARIGWKLYNSDKPAAFVFAVNPWKKYQGA